MNIESFIKSEQLTKWIITVGLVLAALLIFQAGVVVGRHSEEFSSREGNNYYRIFGPGSGMRGFFGEGLEEGHGAAGKIVSVSLPSFLVANRDQTEKTILVDATTTIRNFRDATSSSALSPNEFVIVIGEPTANGEIRATFIRILPPPPGQ